MLRLDIPTEAFWVECPHGVRLLCRPLTTALNQAAVNRASRVMADLRKASPDDPRVTDPDMLAGFTFVEVVTALAQVVVQAWEGVGNADGTAPEALTADGLRALMQVPEIAGAFNAGVSAPLTRMAAEGNA